ILPNQILIADYKTNRDPPTDPAGVPVLYLRQMAAYRAILATHYPTRPVTCLLIWTDGPILMELPSALLETHTPTPPMLDPTPPPDQLLIPIHRSHSP
ncbi:MAG: hypothetical protein ACLQU4_19080, partial [Limisphaerales bacterium]